MKYEYRNHTIVFTDPDRIGDLNALGAQGWRVVFVEPFNANDRNYTSALLMREAADPPAPTETAPQGALDAQMLCDGCGCKKSRCDAYPPGVKCCPDCRHVVPARGVVK